MGTHNFSKVRYSFLGSESKKNAYQKIETIIFNEGPTSIDMFALRLDLSPKIIEKYLDEMIEDNIVEKTIFSEIKKKYPSAKRFTYISNDTEYYYLAGKGL